MDKYMSNYFNIKDFDTLELKSTPRHFNNSFACDESIGEQGAYDIFISHSSANRELISKLRQVLEERFGLSAYIDWDEDGDTTRDEITEKIKNAMDRSKSLLYVKTSESDDSQWVAWEVGRFDAKKPDNIAVLLIEDDKFTADTWRHREFLKDYQILDKTDNIKDFVNMGHKKFFAAKQARDLSSKLNSGAIAAVATMGSLCDVTPGLGTPTKYFGDE